MERIVILRHYLEARRRFTGWSDRCALERWQENRVRRHLRRIAGGSPYFARRVRDFGVAAWRDWPVTHKAEMMAHFDDWNTAGIQLQEAFAFAERAERSRDFSGTFRGLTVGLSSGTSGSRGLFLASASERRRWAGVLLARVLRGTLWSHRHRVALFLRADSPLYHTIGSRRLRFAFFDLLMPLEEHWPRLRTFSPTVLAGPPSVLTELAASGRVLDLLRPPAILLGVADVLDPVDGERIRSGFGVDPGQIYQATEGFLAATCPQGRFHWNEDVIVVQKEWVDAGRTRYVPVLTDFRRSVQPIVRYRLDDVIVRGDPSPCPCGSRFEAFEGIEGRCDDLLRIPGTDGRGEVTIYPDFVRRAFLLSVPLGTDFAVTQISAEEWEISVRPAVDLDGVRQQIGELCRLQGARSPKLTEVPWEPPPLHAKRRRIRRRIAP
ncbi:MAG: adenylate cyclase [Verrucomicrobia bacterium]|nr:adenylate cyclase [Verrucomicrobiota bacterium]